MHPMTGQEPPKVLRKYGSDAVLLGSARIPVLVSLGSAFLTHEPLLFIVEPAVPGSLRT